MRSARMLNSGMSLVEVQGLLGHKHVTSTAVYAHIETGAVAEKAARVLDAMSEPVAQDSQVPKLTVVR